MLLDQFDVEELFEKKCDCFGVATIGTTTAVSAGMIGANIALVGAGISAMGMIQQGKATASQMAFQAAVAGNDAIVAGQQRDRALKTAELDAKDFERQQGDLMAKRRSLMGDTGAQATTGSPLAVSSDFSGESAYNAAKIRNQGFVTANRLEQEIRNKQGQAQLYGMQGQSAMTSSYYKAGGSLFQTGGDIWGKKPWKTT
jgi:hypothetical protein